jgi:hypothetical protein
VIHGFFILTTRTYYSRNSFAQLSAVKNHTTMSTEEEAAPAAAEAAVKEEVAGGEEGDDAPAPEEESTATFQPIVSGSNHSRKGVTESLQTFLV